MKTKIDSQGYATPEQRFSLYRELADWYPLLTPVEDYAEEAAYYLSLYNRYCRMTPHSLLDLGCGGGHNAFYLKESLSCTLLDIEPAMLQMSQHLNPQCYHVQGDMRSFRFGRTFDCLLIHDAVNHMRSQDDLIQTIETASIHTNPGGVALFQPDYISETFTPGTNIGGSDRSGRALRYIEWIWKPESSMNEYIADMAYIMRDTQGEVQSNYERSIMGLFSQDTWVELLAAAGFQPVVISSELSTNDDAGSVIFLGLRPVI
ncbi:MAG: class I SAM-dependent methyltransferase [Spirochaetota bacterium]